MKEFTKWLMIIGICILIIVLIETFRSKNIEGGCFAGVCVSDSGASIAGVGSVGSGGGSDPKYDASRLSTRRSVTNAATQQLNPTCGAEINKTEAWLRTLGQCCVDSDWNDKNVKIVIPAMTKYFDCLHNDISNVRMPQLTSKIDNAKKAESPVGITPNESDPVIQAINSYKTAMYADFNTLYTTAQNTPNEDVTSNNLGKGGTYLPAYTKSNNYMTTLDSIIYATTNQLPSMTRDMSNVCTDAMKSDLDISNAILSFINSVPPRIKEMKINAWNSRTNLDQVKTFVDDSKARCKNMKDMNVHLKPFMDKYRDTCKIAKQMAIDAGDTVDNKVDRQDMASFIQAYSDGIDASINRFKINLYNYSTAYDATKAYDPAIQTAKDADNYCKQQISKYRNWQLGLDETEEKPCKAEPKIQLPGSTDIQNSAMQNAAAIQDVLSTLEARLKVIETNLEQNEVKIGNTTYNDLIIDAEGPQTFDYSLPGTNPVVSIVGSKPQKINFILPMGITGKPGKGGSKGISFLGMSYGARGPPGEQSHYSGLPEQWN